MDNILFFISIIILTIMHVIGDFVTPYRCLGVDWKWFGKNDFNWKNIRILLKTVLLSEWVLVLNPMHGLWDKYSPWRRHPIYLMPVKPEMLSTLRIGNEDMTMYPSRPPKDVHAASWHAQNSNFLIIDSRFWVWLGIDQAYHMLSNVFLAWLIAEIV